jgi:hypothetical protein
MAVIYDYRIGVGAGLALGSLTNIETLLALRGSVFRAAVVNTFPVRTKVLSGKVYGDGAIGLVWQSAAIPIAAIKSIEDTFHTNGTVVSAPVTIYTRQANRATYTRYSAYSILMIPGEDYTYNEFFAYDVRWQFTNLVAL